MKSKKIILFLVIICIINMCFITQVNAMGDIIRSGKEFVSIGKDIDDVIETNNLKTASNFIYNMFLVLAIVLAVGVGTVLGIKFITSSVEGQAKIKEALVPYIVGCIVIFAAFPLWSFIVNAGQDVTGSEDSVFIACACGEEIVMPRQTLRNIKNMGQYGKTYPLSCSSCGQLYLIDLEDYEVTKKTTSTSVSEKYYCDRCNKELFVNGESAIRLSDKKYICLECKQEGDGGSSVHQSESGRIHGGSGGKF